MFYISESTVRACRTSDMNGITEKARSKKKQIKGDTNIYKKRFLQICHSYRTDIAMGMFSDRILILSGPPNWGKSHYNIMEEIQNHIFDIETILDCTYDDGNNNKKNSEEAYYGVALL